MDSKKKKKKYKVGSGLDWVRRKKVGSGFGSGDLDSKKKFKVGSKKKSNPGLDSSGFDEVHSHLW